MSEAQQTLRFRHWPDIQAHIEEAFFHFHSSNPHVYSEFKRLSQRVRSTGRQHYSSKAIIEVLRWNHEIETNSGDFKFNNSFSSCYARLLIEDDKSFQDFFQTRHTPGILEVHHG